MSRRSFLLLGLAASLTACIRAAPKSVTVSGVTRTGQMVENNCGSERMVVFTRGERCMRLLLAAGEARSLGDMPDDADMRVSSETGACYGGRITWLSGGASVTGSTVK